MESKATSKEERMSENKNMDLWNRVSETDPSNTKQVNQRGGFTAIGAQSQVMKATEEFGPFGFGWGVKNERIEKWEDCGLVIYQAILWYKKESDQAYVEIHSSIRYSNNNRVDDDFFKKVATDALTKGLSKLGFNADVFMGKFDDNKYVTTLKQKYKEAKDDKIGKVTEDVKKKVSDAISDLGNSDDFRAKVSYAIDNDKIGENNLESSLNIIQDYKDKLSKESKEGVEDESTK